MLKWRILGWRSLNAHMTSFYRWRNWGPRRKGPHLILSLAGCRVGARIHPLDPYWIQFFSSALILVAVFSIPLFHSSPPPLLLTSSPPSLLLLLSCTRGVKWPLNPPSLGYLWVLLVISQLSHLLVLDTNQIPTVSQQQNSTWQQQQVGSSWDRSLCIL